MESRYLKLNLSIFICLLGAIYLFVLGCHVKKTEESETKEELNKVIKYLDNIKSPSNYFDDNNNIIDFIQTMMQLIVIAAEIEPADFDANHRVAYYYINSGSLIKSLAQSEEHKLLSAEYKKKGFQAAKELVERFPDEAEAYYQLAFFVNIVEGNKKKVLELYKRCLDIDPESDLCRKNYDDLLEELNASSPSN